jgi:hypothetical protein
VENPPPDLGMGSFSDSVAVILGASAWPSHDELGTHKSFANSAAAMSAYFKGNGVAALLDLFDTDLSPDRVVGRVRAFLQAEEAMASRTILLYYVGHGYAREGKYLLALRCTTRDDNEISSLPIRHLARVLYDVASDKRHFVILDSCYAGAADADFIEMGTGEATSLMHAQLRDELPATDIACGTSLFCAASAVKTALARKQDTFTMFTGAVLHVLSNGDADSGPTMTLARVAALVEKHVRTKFRDRAVRPEVRSPRQDDGDLRNVSIFPNPSWNQDPILAELEDKRRALDGLQREMGRLTHELAWEREAENLGWYELRETFNVIDAFGDSLQNHRGICIHGPATGERSEIPYRFDSTSELGTCVIEEIRDLSSDDDLIDSPQQGRDLGGTIDLDPPATVTKLHPGFNLKVKMMNAFAVTKEDAQRRGLDGPESAYVQSLIPARLLRMAVTFPEGYTPAARPVLRVEEKNGATGNDAWIKSPSESARLRHALHFDKRRGIAILAVDRALPRFRYTLQWALPNAPKPGPAAVRAREEIRALIRLEPGKRSEAGLQLARRRDAICAAHFGWRSHFPITVMLSLWVFNEEKRQAQMICHVPEIDGMIVLPSGTGVIGHVMKRRRSLYVDNRDATNVGIYRRVPNQPDDRFVLCVPVPVPAHAKEEGPVSDPGIPCVIAALTCVDESGNLERLTRTHGPDGIVSDELMRRVAFDMVDAAVEVMSPLV